MKIPLQIVDPAKTGAASSATASGPALFAYGFRPFFLLAGIYAAFAIPVWIASLHYIGLSAAPLPAPVWHAHEMLYGFIAAAVAGFLLTAVPSWTGQRGFAGAPLIALTLLWLAGRIAVSIPLGLSPLWVALFDLAFYPALGLTIVPALIRSGNRRNLVFIVLLALLFGANLNFHYRGAADSEPLLLTVNLMLFMVALVGGRILPAFTSSGLKMQGVDIRIRRYPPLDWAIPLAMAAIVGIDLFAAGGALAAVAASIGALLLALQLLRWQGWRTLRLPILWVLHVAYAWLAIGLALKAAWAFGAPVPAMSWLHALTAGAFSTMIIGVMSRAALGHTGRELIAPRGMTAAYLLITGAALLRVFGPLLLPAAWSSWTTAAAALWSLAFVLFVAIYAPILCRPRIDGRPG